MNWQEQKQDIIEKIKIFKDNISLFYEKPGDKSKQEQWFSVFMSCEKACESAYISLQFKFSSLPEEDRDIVWKDWQRLARIYNTYLKRYDMKKIKYGMSGDHWYRWETIYKGK